MQERKSVGLRQVFAGYFVQRGGEKIAREREREREKKRKRKRKKVIGREKERK